MGDGTLVYYIWISEGGCISMKMVDSSTSASYAIRKKKKKKKKNHLSLPLLSKTPGYAFRKNATMHKDTLSLSFQVSNH